MFERLQSSDLFGTQLSDIEITFQDSQHDKRFYLLLVATTSTGVKLGCDWLYDRRVQPNMIPTMVKKVSDDLLAEIQHGGCVDEHLRDQLVVFQALAQGRSKVWGGRTHNGLVDMSLHAQTAKWVAEEMLGVRFDDEGGCTGVGFCHDEKGDSVHVDEYKDEDELVGKMEELDVSTLRKSSRLI